MISQPQSVPAKLLKAEGGWRLIFQNFSDITNIDN